MGRLKPIGSEKLQGMDKINRIMEIARYKENKPTPVNEDKSVEYKITLSDGNTYRIDREKNGYVIKKGLNESYDYIEPMKNRKYYSSYSQAFKRLNLIAKEVNVNEGYAKNISLFTESDDVKYYLNLKGGETDEQAAPAAPAPVAAPADPAAVPEPAPADPAAAAAPEDVPMPDDVPMPEDDMGEPETDGEDEDEVVTFKTIQKVTGKLAQKIRTFLSDEENEMSSKDIKYVINSVLSALNLDGLDEEDKESIIDKLEGIAEEGDEDMGDMEGEDMGDEVPDMSGEELTPEAPPVPEPEMSESFGFGFDDDEDEEEEDFKHRGARKRRLHHSDISDDEAFQVEDMIESIFSESKVNKVIDKYFGKTPTKKESKFGQVQRLSESKSQEVASIQIMSKYPNSKLIGKTPKKDLVFEANGQQIKVSTKGGYRLL